MHSYGNSLVEKNRQIQNIPEIYSKRVTRNNNHSKSLKLVPIARKY